MYTVVGPGYLGSSYYNIGGAPIVLTVPPVQTGAVQPMITGNTIYSSTSFAPPTHKATLNVNGEDPSILLNGTKKIDLTGLYDLMTLFKQLQEKGMTLPIIPDFDMMEEHPVLKSQWEDLLNVCNQYIITQSLLTKTKDNK